jgi:peroxiredoxin
MKGIFMYKSIIFTLFILFISMPIISNQKEPGDKADDFTLSNWDGKNYNLANEISSDKIVVVMFWSTQCPFVQAYHERAKELYNAFTESGVSFWAVNANSTESIKDVEAQAKEHGYPFPVLKDIDNKVADMLGASRTPEVYVIGKDRVILYHGRIDDSKDASQVTSQDLKNALNEIIAGKDVTIKITKFFGCTIKKKS